MEQFRRLIEIVARLRGPDGCPWDKAQDHASLKPYLIEEAYEVAQAIDRKEAQKLAEELGDLLLHVVFHAQLAAEEKHFDIEDVCRLISEKLIKRHPHVFSAQEKITADEVLSRWEDIKRDNNLQYSALDGIPLALPALLKAYRIQEKVGRLGFDWQDPAGVWVKIKEELAEFEAASASGDRQKACSEFGDLLFSLVNLGRHLGLRAEEALQSTNEKFIRRFQFIEKELARLGKTPGQASLQEMDALWEKAKGDENG